MASVPFAETRALYPSFEIWAASLRQNGDRKFDPNHDDLKRPPGPSVPRPAPDEPDPEICQPTIADDDPGFFEQARPHAARDIVVLTLDGSSNRE